MDLKNKSEYVYKFCGEISPYYNDIDVLFSKGVITRELKSKLITLRSNWQKETTTDSSTSNNFILMINLMHKAIKDYENK